MCYSGRVQSTRRGHLVIQSALLSHERLWNSRMALLCLSMELGLDQCAQVCFWAVPALEHGRTFIIFSIRPPCTRYLQVLSKCQRPATSCSFSAEEARRTLLFQPRKNCRELVDHSTGDYDGDGCQAALRHSRGVCLSPTKRNTGNGLWLQIQTHTGLARKT